LQKLVSPFGKVWKQNLYSSLLFVFFLLQCYLIQVLLFLLCRLIQLPFCKRPPDILNFYMSKFRYLQEMIFIFFMYILPYVFIYFCWCLFMWICVFNLQILSSPYLRSSLPGNIEVRSYFISFFSFLTFFFLSFFPCLLLCSFM
jgi:hypothetical protein